MFELIYQPNRANAFKFEEEKFESQEALKKRCEELIQKGFEADDLMIWQGDLEIEIKSILTSNK